MKHVADERRALEKDWHAHLQLAGDVGDTCARTASEPALAHPCCGYASFQVCCRLRVWGYLVAHLCLLAALWGAFVHGWDGDRGVAALLR